MHNLVDAAVMDARRLCDLPLGVPEFSRLANQAVPLGFPSFYAADFVSQCCELEQRAFASHRFSSKLLRLLVAMTCSVLAETDTQMVQSASVA